MDLLIDERKKEKADSNTGKFSENGEIEILRKIAEHKPLSFVLLDPTGFMLQISSRKIEYGKRNFSTHICSCSRWVTEHVDKQTMLLLSFNQSPLIESLDQGDKVSGNEGD